MWHISHGDTYPPNVSTFLTHLYILEFQFVMKILALGKAIFVQKSSFDEIQSAKIDLDLEPQDECLNFSPFEFLFPQ